MWVMTAVGAETVEDEHGRTVLTKENQEKVEKMIQRADNNGDGDVDFCEFCELMCVQPPFFASRVMRHASCVLAIATVAFVCGCVSHSCFSLLRCSIMVLRRVSSLAFDGWLCSGVGFVCGWIAGRKSTRRRNGQRRKRSLRRKAAQSRYAVGKQLAAIARNGALWSCDLNGESGKTEREGARAEERARTRERGRGGGRGREEEGEGRREGRGRREEGGRQWRKEDTPTR